MGRKQLLTEAEVLDAIRALTAYRIVAVPPSLNDVAQHLGIGSTRTIWRYVSRLSKRGLVQGRRGKAGIRVK